MGKIPAFVFLRGQGEWLPFSLTTSETQFTSFTSVIFACRGSQDLCCHQPEQWLSSTSLQFTSFSVLFFFFKPWTSGIKYCKLSRTATHFNINISLIKFAANQPPSFKKTQTWYWVWRHCPSTANSQTSKITSAAIQFKSRHWASVSSAATEN